MKQTSIEATMAAISHCMLFVSSRAGEPTFRAKDMSLGSIYLDSREEPEPVEADERISKL